MADLTLGIMRPSGAAGVLERAADKLGVPIPPTDEARIQRGAVAIQSSMLSQLGDEGRPETTDDDCAIAVYIDEANRLIDCEALARVAIAAYEAP